MAKEQKRQARRPVKAPPPGKPARGREAPASKSASYRIPETAKLRVVIPPAPAVRAPAKPAPAPPAHAGNMCSGCNAACCDLRVDLTPFDIARIVHQEKRNPNEFVELMKATLGDSFSFRTRHGRVKLVLRKENGKCMFKREGDLKCAIEGSKPAVCLIYPFSSNYGIPYIRSGSLCPKENQQKADYAKMSNKALTDAYWEASRYIESIRLWNRYAKGTEDLDRFLAFVSSDIDSDHKAFGSLRRDFGRYLLRIGLR